jgi:hypothetical protein
MRIRVLNAYDNTSGSASNLGYPGVFSKKARFTDNSRRILEQFRLTRHVLRSLGSVPPVSVSPYTPKTTIDGASILHR